MTKRLWLPSGALLLALWACDRAGLPSEYRDVAVPEARLTSTEARLRGRELFLAHCAICHGEKADGRGRRRNLSGRPQDLTDPAWHRRSPPRRIFYVVREGKPGTAMGSWKALDVDQTWDLVAYLLTLSDGGQRGGRAPD